MKANSPPASYFKKEPYFTSPDAITRNVSNGRVGLYEGRYVDLTTKLFISKEKADRLARKAVLSLADNPALSLESTQPELADCFNSDHI